MYDVAIVGAGPAGATTARYLGKMGYSVILIDRNTFPRDKPCGGGFSYGLLDEFDYLKRREQEFLQGICKVGVLHSPNRRIILRGKVDMAVALRYDFDNVIYESAIETGIESISGQRAKKISHKSDSVEIGLQKGESVEARAIIGADGVSSIVAREYGLHRRWSSSAITACRVAEVPEALSFIEEAYSKNKDYHFWANLGGMPGYGWIFPKRDTINIGLGIVGSHAQGLPKYFDQFVKMLKHDGLLRQNLDLSMARGALVPTGGTIKQSVADRCIVVGDSAGMVSPLTGGGIHYAMRAAKMAAQTISQGLDADDLSLGKLMKYQKLWQSDFGKDMGPMLFAQKLFTGAFADLLFEIGSRDAQIQTMVSEAMAESSEGISVAKLALRALKVISREAIHL